MIPPPDALTFGSWANLANPTREYARILNCGCWRVNLGQGVAVLPCIGHQAAVLAAIERSN